MTAAINAVRTGKPTPTLLPKVPVSSEQVINAA